MHGFPQPELQRTAFASFPQPFSDFLLPGTLSASKLDELMELFKYLPDANSLVIPLSEEDQSIGSTPIAMQPGPDSANPVCSNTVILGTPDGILETSGPGIVATTDHDTATRSCRRVSTCPVSSPMSLPNMPLKAEAGTQGPTSMPSLPWNNAADVRSHLQGLKPNKAMHAEFVQRMQWHYNTILAGLGRSHEEIIGMTIKFRNAWMAEHKISNQDRAIIMYMRRCASEAEDCKRYRQIKKQQRGTKKPGTSQKKRLKRG